MSGASTNSPSAIRRNLKSIRRTLMRRMAVIGFTGGPFLITLSLIIGVAVGVGSLVFRWMIEFFRSLFFNETRGGPHPPDPDGPLPPRSPA